LARAFRVSLFIVQSVLGSARTMDAEMLRTKAATLEVLTEDLVAAMDSTPEVLVLPLLKQVRECKEKLYEVVAEALRFASREPSEEAKRKLSEKESKISELVTKLKEQLAEEPWHNPPALRTVRLTVTALATAAAGLQRAAAATTAEAEPLSGWRQLGEDPRQCSVGKPDPALPMVAPAAADMVGGRGGGLDADDTLPVDEALAMLLDKKPVGYRGGLIGIVHAAGVQEMTAFPAHSPAKFEFLFAPKTSALYNMHQFSALM